MLESTPAARPSVRPADRRFGLGVALAHAALSFVLGHPAVSSVVLGAVSPDEVRRNAGAFARPVPAALWRDLRSERLLRDDAPTPA